MCEESMNSEHISVLMGEVKALLNLKEGDKAIDATFGFGGHTRMMLEEVGSEGKILGIEQDKEIIAMAKNVPENLKLVNGNFRDIGELTEREGFAGANAILMDLGVSRWHFLVSGRGFSFQDRNEPLIMNLDRTSEITAARILNSAGSEELRDIFVNYGEIRYPVAGRLAKKITEARRTKKIISVGDLLDICERIMPRQGKTNPATKVFQALRIATNNELENLKIGLEASIGILAKGGRLAVISFHSLEDRIVKKYFISIKDKAKILTKKPVEAARGEVLKNPSSRSAKLRAIEKI